MVAAVRLRLSVRLRRVHRSQVDRRVAPCVCENPRKPRVYALYLLAVLRTCACTNAFACIDARSRVCASERNRAYVTAWLGAQIQRAQLAHRTSRRIVLILRLHSRGVEAASYRLEPTGRLCFKAEKRQGFVWILGGGGE